MRPAVAVSLEVIMGEMRIFRRPAVALVALAFPLVAVGAFALGTGYDLGGESTTTTAVVADTQQAPAEAQQTADPLSKARSSLNSASLPITFLSSGIGQLTEGGTQLNDGVGQLADGITQAHDGTIQLADGFGQYRDGIGQLGDGASQISGGVDQVVDQLAGFGGSAGRLHGKARRHGRHGRSLPASGVRRDFRRDPRSDRQPQHSGVRSRYARSAADPQGWCSAAVDRTERPQQSVPRCHRAARRRNRAVA